MVNIAISGAGKGGCALLDSLESEEEITIVGIVDKNKNAPALKIAQEHGIFTSTKIEDLIDLSTHIVINATGLPEHSEVIKKIFPYPIDVIEGESARLLWTIVNSHRKSQADIKSLYDCSKQVSASGSLQEALDEILKRSMQITGSSGGSLALIEDDEISISSQIGLSVELPRHTGWKLSGNKLASKVLKGKKPVAFHNIKDNALFEGTTFLREGIHSMLAAPLLLNGKALGILCLHDLKARPYSKREKTLIGLISATAAQSIEKFKLLHDKEKSINYLQSILNDSQDMIITTDNEGRIVKFSKGGERILGFPQEEMADKEVTTLYANRAERLEIQKTVEEKGAIYNYETTLLKKDGLPVDISLTISQLKDEANNIIGTVGISKNITEEKRLRKELEEKNMELEKVNESLEQKVLERTRALEESNKELKKASEMKDRFIANASHELRTPLNSIIGFSEILLEKSFGEINEKQERYISNVLKSGMHLLHLVNNVLDLAKIESGKSDLDYDNFQLKGLVDEIFSALGTIAKKKGLKLINDIPTDINISADRIKLTQIFYNLFSNAIKFTDEGGKAGIRLEKVRGDKSLTWAPAGEEFLKMSIWDTGMGISADDLNRVFYEFEQADTSKATEGSGLGLPLTRKLVELHSGHIDVESRLGEGSTFNVYLPSTTYISSKLPGQEEGPLTDELTGLFNSTYFDIRINQEVSRAKRYKEPLGVAFLTIDHFGQAKKTKGEDNVRRILKTVSAFLRVNLRTSDILSRYKNDTFAIIFPNTPHKEAKRLAKRYVTEIVNLGNKSDKDSHLLKITVSIGLSEFNGQRVNELLQITDAALSLAKEKGGNRVEIIKTP